MKRTICVLVLGLAAAFLTFGVQAAEEKEKGEKKLTGTITCAKCDLKETEKCTTVIVVKEKEEKVTYFFDKDSAKKYHSEICTAAKEGTVTGTTAKDGKKMVVTVKSLEFKK